MADITIEKKNGALVTEHGNLLRAAGKAREDANRNLIEICAGLAAFELASMFVETPGLTRIAFTLSAFEQDTGRDVMTESWLEIESYEGVGVSQDAIDQLVDKYCGSEGHGADLYRGCAGIAYGDINTIDREFSIDVERADVQSLLDQIEAGEKVSGAEFIKAFKLIDQVGGAYPHLSKERA